MLAEPPRPGSPRTHRRHPETLKGSEADADGHEGQWRGKVGGGAGRPAGSSDRRVPAVRWGSPSQSLPWGPAWAEPSPRKNKPCKCIIGGKRGEKKSKYVCIYPEQCCWYRWVTCFPSLLSLPPRKPKRSVGFCSPASLQGKIWGSSKHPGQWREQGCCLPQQDVIQDDAVHGDAT